MACSRRQAAGGVSLLGRAEHQHAVGTEIGAEIDQVANVLPAAAAQSCIGAGDVQALGADHQPVQSDERRALRSRMMSRYSARCAALTSRGSFGQREGRDLDSRITGLADRLAGVGERPLIEGLVADGMAKHHELSVYKSGSEAEHGEFLPAYLKSTIKWC